KGKPLLTLKDAANCITRLPRRTPAAARCSARSHGPDRYDTTIAASPCQITDKTLMPKSPRRQISMPRPIIDLGAIFQGNVRIPIAWPMRGGDVHRDIGQGEGVARSGRVRQRGRLEARPGRGQ